MKLKNLTALRATEGRTGKKTKVPVGIVLHNVLKNYPHIQELIDRAFGVEEIC